MSKAIISELDQIKNLKHGEELYFDMFEEGGALAVMVHNVYVLFEIPQYGGSPVYHDTYADATQLYETGKSWT